VLPQPVSTDSFTSQQAAKYFGSAGSSIINISLIASTTKPATASVYSATKAAVGAVTKSLAKELGSRKIRVNSIYQSWDGGNEGYTGSGSYWERLPKTD
jgi:NAD(P)-dependent dehydrogenase (short-subunit alcohol dehydrogenase family)